MTCQVDLAMFHDSSGPRRLKPMLDQLGARIWNTSKVVLVLDHYVPANDDASEQIIAFTRKTANEWKLPHVIDSLGICHVVMPERGYIHPGMMCVGGDSHSSTGGAFGSYMFGIGATEMLGVVVMGEIWVQVPETIRMHWQGTLSPGVYAKDMMLHMVSRFGMNGGAYQAVEFCGDTIKHLNMQERMTLSNMSAELGAQVGLIAPDEITQQYLIEHQNPGFVPFNPPLGQDQLDDLKTDSDAQYSQFEFDASQLAPQIAAPHSPANSRPVHEFSAESIDVAYIGACTGAKLEDLRAAAKVLKGKKIANGTRLIVAPASAIDQSQAIKQGILQILLDAGATLAPNSCGACAGYGSTFESNSRVISSTARNFKGRMGPDSVQVYLASPATVAACAVTGKITDVREML